MPNVVPEQVFKTIVREVKNAIRDLFPADAKPQRLGLAISGGVDSMALATLTTLIRKDSTFPHTFTGFIVDHRSRNNSSEEATLVAKSLEQLHIEPSILRLDWSGHGDPRKISNFETVARTLRYQALGKACAAKKISYLMVGHHADDQAETVLSRAMNGYTGLGLQGIASTAPIPECKGIYGVDSSGSAYARDDVGKFAKRYSRSRKRIAVEQGGVSIHRPLLRYTKNQLQMICRSHGVSWQEDATNLDKTLTIRNSIRHLQEGSLLPKALLRSRVVEVAETARQRKRRIEDHAGMMFAMTPIKLDLRSGKAVATVSQARQEFGDAPYNHHVEAAFLRKLLLLASPGAAVSLQDLDQCVDLVFAPSETLSSSPRSGKHTTQISGVLVTRAETAEGSPYRTITLQREVPARIERNGKGSMQFVHSHGGWSQWLLWDHRYWIRVYEYAVARDPNTTMHMAHLTPESLGELRKRLKNASISTHRLEQALSQVPGKERWTVPVIVFRSNGEDRIVGLPTLRWIDTCWQQDGLPHRPGRWEIRYKKIDFPQHDCHKLMQ